MHVLVTGGAGYIGSTLIRLLLEKGYKVRCLDRFFFGKEAMSELVHKHGVDLELVRDDIRRTNSEVFLGVDQVIDLASLSNDPSGELDPSKTMEINYQGRVRVATLAKKCGVKRYILASSCSVYGFQDGTLTEDSEPRPLTTYARANSAAEREILPLTDECFTTIVLRQATVYGLSLRMRFDLAVNGMVLGLFRNGKIPILRDGQQWRPFVHVKDSSKAFIMAMEANRSVVAGQIFNIGSNAQNYQIFDLARMVADAVGLPFRYEWYGSPDNRSYKVRFDKALFQLGFTPDYTPADGARDVYHALKEQEVGDGMKSITVQWYKHLLEMQHFIRETEIGGALL